MEEEQDQKDSSGIMKPLSAYHHYSRTNSSLVKEELLKEGKDTALGVVVSVVAARFKALAPEEKAKYEKMALDDKERYARECAVRDEEVLRQQEERRKAHAVGAETETRMRGTTVAYSDASTIKADSKKKRELTDKEKEKIQERKQAKLAEQSAVKGQLEELKKERMAQAESRLQYLLSQSDIFSHFGAVKADSTGTGAAAAGAAGSSATVLSPGGTSRRAAAASSSSSSSSSSSAAAAGTVEMDDDERAMADEEDDEEEEGAGASSHKSKRKGHVLLKQPSCISFGTMRAYQLEGLNWMIRLQENGINGILADEMGLGKTLQSISILGFMHEFLNTSGPHLVMVPKSTLSNWCNEFKRWCPVLRVLRFHGSKEERAEIIEEKLKPVRMGQRDGDQDRDWDVVITTYEVVNLERSVLTKLSWNYLVIDEAHRLKNEASQFSMTVRQLSTKYRLLLTGTPLQNNLHELWALLNFLLPDVFASAEQFDDWFNLDVDDQEAKQRMIGQLHKLLRPFMLRRLKADVEKSLPPKSETILFTGMSAVQKNLYRQVLLRDIDTINTAGASSSQGSRTAILNIVMQLRKCCNHPYLFPGIEDRTQDPMGEHLYTTCGKMVLLHKLLKKMKERGHRVLIFSQMTRMIDILEDYLISQQYLYCRIDGNTTYEEREDRIAAFNEPNSEIFAFVLSTRAGGLGINLQTADTVILYDSDWNPQADLQAQDRAHRIGQKKPVQVFRLVTDETVEVKVVERAQQKLKLDAMVVQQGRLQDKEKKMTKQDLLDTLRFGADKIFRSKDSTISDEDIDLILEQGRKRTEQMAQLQVAEKGDMYDFRLDGGMATQVFEGKDYSDKNMRQQEAQQGMSLMASLPFLDTGKRERKAITSYAETIARQAAAEEGDKKQKLPRHLRLGRMEDWQFFNKTRLNELQAEEIRLFDQLVEKGEAPNPGSIAGFVMLPPELMEEKVRLQSEGFGDWTRVHFNNFVRATAKHGRSAYDKIAKDVGRPAEEVARFAQTFWSRGATTLPAAEWERYVKQIEKGEKRLEEISRLTTATAKLITMFDDPWEELTFRNVGNQGRVFNAIEDRFLLCLTHLHGYGSWEQVRNSVRRCERFRFDFYLQSCSAEVLGKRCELLMRSAERELLEMERKRQAAEGNAHGAAGGAVSKLKSQSEVVKERLGDLTKQIADESKRLANTRSQLQKLKTSSSSTVLGNGTGVTVNAVNGATSSAGIMKAFLGAASGSGSSSSSKQRAGAAAGGGGGGNGEAGAGGEQRTSNVGAVAAVVPNGAIPELCRILMAAKSDGITKVVENFRAKFTSVSRRQTELKVNEMAVKEKRPGDKYIIWHLKPEYEKFTHMTPEEAEADIAANPPVSTSALAAEGGGSSSAAVSGSGKKRKGAPDENAPAGSPPASAAEVKEPRRYKRAFGHFVKAKRAEAEAKLGAEASQTDQLKELLGNMWAEADAEVRKKYEKKEVEDKARYEKELALYNAAKKGAGEASSKKKAKKATA